MARFRPEDFAIDRHGIHEVVGPLLAGGVNLIGERTGIFSDEFFRHALADDRRFRAHLEFRERAFQIAVPGLFSAAKSPVDLFRLLEWDPDQFLRSHGRHDRTSSEHINSELSSALQKHLDLSDCMLMEQYYDRMKLRSLARECATQAQTIGVILVGEALPVPVNPEVRTLLLTKRIQRKFRGDAARLRPWQLLALGTLATAVGLNGKLGLDSEGSHS